MANTSEVSTPQYKHLEYMPQSQYQPNYPVVATHQRIIIPTSVTVRSNATDTDYELLVLIPMPIENKINYW